MAKQRVLVTGVSGLIGGAVRRQLEGKCDLTGLNRRPMEGVACHQADIGDLDAILPAFDGQDVVVHLAAIAHGEAPWEDVLHHNVVGAYNVFEAARRAGVKRVVFASSGATISGCERDFPYSAVAAGRYDEVPETWEKMTHMSPPRPSGLYGCSKLWGEALGRHFSDAHGISVICLRIGAVTPQDRPVQTRQHAVWCSQRDVAQMIEKCIEAPPEVRFEIFYVVSDNRWGYRDLEHAREVLGYEPQDSAEQFKPS